MADARDMTHAKPFQTSARQGHPVRGRTLGLSGASTTKMLQRIEKGFSYQAVVRLHKASGLPVGSIAQLVRIPQRTLMRRKAQGRLRPEESERLLRVSGVFEKALDLFEGNADRARQWLTTPSKELENQSPLHLARTEVGAREVEDLIGRLEHGVFT